MEGQFDPRFETYSDVELCELIMRQLKLSAEKRPHGLLNAAVNELDYRINRS